MIKLSDTKSHLLMRLANVRPIAMPHRIAQAGPGNKRTIDSLTRTGHLDADGKITQHGLHYVMTFLGRIRAAEMAAQAATDATPKMTPETTTDVAERDAKDEAYGYARFLNMMLDVTGVFVTDPEPGSRVIEMDQVIKWQRRHGVVNQGTESWYLAFLADEAKAHAENERRRATLTRTLATLARSTMLDVFTPNGDAGVITRVGKVFNTVYVSVSPGMGDRDRSGWYDFDRITAGRDLMRAAAK